jgi:hypothetical protein
MNTQTRISAVNERGIALVITLFLLAVVSMLSASLMFLSQTETYASANYRQMSQSRYGAEAGAQSAMNYLQYTYVVPGDVTDPMANYNVTVSPVTYLGKPVVLSANPAVASNYPVAAKIAAFNAAVPGTLAAGNSNINYTAWAQLVSMRQFQMYGGATGVVQTWQITSDGSIPGSRASTEEIVSTLEQQIVPAAPYAAFAEDPSCGALTFAGNEVIDSYDSSSMVMSGGSPVTQASGGNVGTNGNLTLSGTATIDGKLYTPRTGVGSCAVGAVDALTLKGGATVTEGLVQLPAPQMLALPATPSPMPPTTGTSFTKTSGCGAAPSCTSAGADVTLTGGTSAAPLVLGNVDVSTKGFLHLTAGYYNFNSITVSSNAGVVIDSGPVVLNIAGASQPTPIDFSGGSVTNGGFDPSKFQVLYAGNGNIKLVGGASTAMMIYAPAANASFPASNATFYGSIMAQDVSANGAQIHYDRHLSTLFFTTGNHMMSTFSWKKY